MYSWLCTALWEERTCNVSRKFILHTIFYQSGFIYKSANHEIQTFCRRCSHCIKDLLTFWRNTIGFTLFCWRPGGSASETRTELLSSVWMRSRSRPAASSCPPSTAVLFSSLLLFIFLACCNIIVWLTNLFAHQPTILKFEHETRFVWCSQSGRRGRFAVQLLVTIMFGSHPSQSKLWAWLSNWVAHRHSVTLSSWPRAGGPHYCRTWLRRLRLCQKLIMQRCD